MVYVEELDTAYVFGGLHWKSQPLRELHIQHVVSHFFCA